MGLLLVAEAVIIKKRRWDWKGDEKRMVLGKVAEKAEGRRDLEERERDGFLRDGVWREAIVDMWRCEIEEERVSDAKKIQRASEGMERESGEFIFR